jgi:predicted O-linked N-acetylglucosamine transferase (SPINDLY family)
MTLQEQLESGVSHHQAGRLAEAEAIYRQILLQQPNHAEAYTNLAMVLYGKGQLEEAIAACRQAVRLRPDSAGAHSNLGNALQSKGQLEEAITCFRQAIRLKPDFAGAHSNLGNALKDKGQLEEAVVSFRQAIRLKPDYAEAYSNLANALMDLGQLDEAMAACRQAIGLKPDLAEAHYNTGVIWQRRDQPDEAIASYRQAILLRPGYAEAHNNLGNALTAKGQLDEAIASCRQAIWLKPELAEAHNNLGNALKARGQVDEAIGSFRQAIRLRPDLAEAHSDLGAVLMELGELHEAIACHRQAIRLKPDFAEAHNNLGNALTGQGLSAEAIAAYRQAIRLKPDFAEAYSNLGSALTGMEQFDEAIAACRHAIRLKPDYVEAHTNLGAAFEIAGRLDEAIATCRLAIQLKPDNSDNYVNLLYALYHHPDYDSRRILEETRQWAKRQGAGAAIHSPPRDRTLQRRLKIGYLSPFFGTCADAHYIFPLLAHHDRKRFEIFCYTRATRDDELTERMRSHCDHWLDIRRLGIAESAELIRGHGIDILVNMSRPADECLRIMANRLAPIQITWMTFASCTTGLETMDYRISDPHLDPVGMDELCYAEKTLRLPETAWCYDPLFESPLVTPLPALASGSITFGSLNRLSKINPSVVAAWAEILRAVPDSRLHILAGLGSHRQRLLDQFREPLVDPRRIEFIDKQSRFEYLKQYGRIDITLDTFPFSGHTTSFDSFWMGVPVIMLVGQTVVGRAGLSQLSNLGLPELIARTPEQYVQIAAELAGDLPRLAELRRTLRARMQASALMDAPRFARNIEAAYRRTWRNWCEQGGV